MTWKFACIIPGYGFGVIEVEADTEEEAKEIARDEFAAVVVKFKIAEIFRRVMSNVTYPEDPSVN